MDIEKVHLEYNITLQLKGAILQMMDNVISKMNTFVLGFTIDEESMPSLEEIKLDIIDIKEHYLKCIECLNYQARSSRIDIPSEITQWTDILIDDIIVGFNILITGDKKEEERRLSKKELWGNLQALKKQYIEFLEKLQNYVEFSIIN